MNVSPHPQPSIQTMLNDSCCPVMSAPFPSLSASSRLGMYIVLPSPIVQQQHVSSILLCENSHTLLLTGEFLSQSPLGGDAPSLCTIVHIHTIYYAGDFNAWWRELSIPLQLLRSRSPVCCAAAAVCSKMNFSVGGGCASKRGLVGSSGMLCMVGRGPNAPRGFFRNLPHFSHSVSSVCTHSCPQHDHVDGFKQQS